MFWQVYCWIGKDYPAGTFSLYKQYIITGMVTDPQHETKYPNSYDICFLSSTTCSIPEDVDHIKLQDKSTNNKDKNLTLKIIQKDDLIEINNPPRSRLPMFISFPLPPKYVPQFLPNRVYRVQKLKNQTLQFYHPQEFMLAKN